MLCHSRTSLQDDAVPFISSVPRNPPSWDNFPHHFLNLPLYFFKALSWEFPGGPLVRTLHFHCSGGSGSIPGRRTKIPNVMRHSQRKRFFLIFLDSSTFWLPRDLDPSAIFLIACQFLYPLASSLLGLTCSNPFPMECGWEGSPSLPFPIAVSFFPSQTSFWKDL